MVTANELLNRLSVSNSENEGHIVVGVDRKVTVPESLKRIAVQFDHNVETVTFDCPRYWDGLDMSKMAVYINYMRSDKFADSYPVGAVTVDDVDPNIMHFDWTISRNVTSVDGGIVFLVCVKNTDEDGLEINHWNSELCKDLTVSPGMENDEQLINDQYDLITQLLLEVESLREEVENIEITGDEVFEVEQTYNPESENPQSGKAVAEAIKSKPGEVTLTGLEYGQSAYANIRGERFNDYDDTNGNKALAVGSHAEGIRSTEYDGTKETTIQNIAGCGCFEIDSKSISNSYYYYPNFDTTNKTITVKGDASAYAAGDVISVITDTNFDECATISSVSYNGKDKTVITLQKWPEGLKQGSNIILNYNELVKSYVPMTLRVVAKPLIGTTYLGLGAHTEGIGSRALADGAHAEGRETNAVGRYSHTEGRETKAHYAAHAEGWKSKAIGIHSHAEGENTTASGYNSHAECDSTVASGKSTHAEGYNTKAEGNMSHAEGNKSQATGFASHAEGDQNIASNSAAHAEGYKTQATGTMSHAEGENNIASANAAHAEGRWTEANHQGSHAGGYATRTGMAYQTVIGKYNKGLNNTLFEVGDGTASTEEGRRNAFEVYNDGHAELRVQGETDNSVIIKKSLLSVYNELNSKIEKSSGTAAIDQTYNPESENAQSGKAVAEALATIGGGNGGTWETVADITIPEGFSSYNYIITEATYPDITRITDFYIEISVPIQSEGVISGALQVQAKSVVSTYYTNIARFETWNHANYIMKGALFSKLFGDKRHNQYYGLAANATQSLANNSLLGGLNIGYFKELNFVLSDTTKTLPAGMTIKIVGCKV